MILVTVGICALMAFVLGGVTAYLSPMLCLHKWEKWKEVQGLSITTTTEYGKETKDYRRFERTCQRCGEVQLRNKRTA